MGSSKPELTYRGAYIRPILLVYTVLMILGNSYNCVTEQHPLIKYHSYSILSVHIVVFLGVIFNTPLVLRWATLALKLFMLLYICNFLALPVIIASFRSSGALNHEGTSDYFIEKLRCYFKYRVVDQEQTEMERQFDIHTKKQILHVFGDNDTRLEVEAMFKDPTDRKYLMKVADSEEFKEMVEQGLRPDNFLSRVIFNKITGDICRKELIRAGIWSGYGIELACLLTIGLIYILHFIIKRLWLHSLDTNHMRQEFEYY
ncbi:hypothetical protein L3Y34_009167 [Caenorhabditis briggsae]|uniref:Uncharacterized protein n=1 Tax=Caenorhabditis briggsae TaxID=6238 RepID=A0AAE9A7N7_CAEBR|nr:hypothetical protein L3Y34_009167 [Caenorhabditis briggsae]